ncbi:MAG: hypothetical protein AB7F28_00590 [Candidatus Margulisiibacteriota bacterium]
MSKPIIPAHLNETRCQNFIVFEPAASRISELDILITGERVREIAEELMIKVAGDESLPAVTIQNRLAKIGQMMDLLETYDGLIITKFFDRIWRRYSHVSNLGELFLDMKTFLEFFPQYGINPDIIMAQRLDMEDEMEGDGAAEVSVESDVNLVR